jgi:hypothetical protein
MKKSLFLLTIYTMLFALAWQQNSSTVFDVSIIERRGLK